MDYDSILAYEPIYHITEEGLERLRNLQSIEFEPIDNSEGIPVPIEDSGEILCHQATLEDAIEIIRLFNERYNKTHGDSTESLF